MRVKSSCSGRDAKARPPSPDLLEWETVCSETNEQLVIIQVMLKRLKHVYTDVNPIGLDPMAGA